MAEKQVTLNAEDAAALYDLVDDAIRETTREVPTDKDRRIWRLFVKMDKVLRDGYHPLGMLNALPPWVRVIFHKTFAPAPVAARPKARAVHPVAKKATRKGAAKTAARAPKASSAGGGVAASVGTPRTSPEAGPAAAAAARAS